MLDQKYEAGRKRKGPEWKKLDDLFWQIRPQHVGFISMNWDTVIERMLASTGHPLIDYCCDARHAAGIQEPPDLETSGEREKYMEEIEKSQVVMLAPTRGTPSPPRKTSTPIVKIHGSANWLYCDNCRQLFWFSPDESGFIPNQIIRREDFSRIMEFLPEKRSLVEDAIRRHRQYPEMRCCLCSEKVALGTRIATFSYRKALDFPMFHNSWLAAEELLRSARRWVFIGYSLPAADYEFKYLLKRTQLSRAKPPEFVVITGGKELDIGRTLDNYRRFLGRAVDDSNRFRDGLTPDAVAACCRNSRLQCALAHGRRCMSARDLADAGPQPLPLRWQLMP